MVDDVLLSVEQVGTWRTEIGSAVHNMGVGSADSLLWEEMGWFKDPSWEQELCSEMFGWEKELEIIFVSER